MPSTPPELDHQRHQLVLLPLGTLTDERALELIDRLDVVGALEVVHAARIGRSQNGAVGPVEVVRPGDPPLGRDGWRWLLAAVIRAGPPSGGTPPVAGVSASFAAEVRAALAAACRWVALVSRRVEPGAAVEELAGFPEARLVYGALPDAALAEARQTPRSASRAHATLSR